MRPGKESGKDWWSGFFERHPEVSLVRDIERLEKMLADAEDGRIRAESARLQESLRLPLANVVNTTTTAPTKRRSVGALRAKDGKARLVTSAGLQADLEEADQARKDKEAAKKANSATTAGKRGRPRKARVPQVTAQDDDGPASDQEN